MLQDLLSRPSFYLDCGAKSGGFSCQKSANGTLLLEASNLVIHAPVAVFIYALGMTYELFAGFVHRLGMVFPDLVKDCMV